MVCCPEGGERMGRVLVIASGKGGVGKTTVTASLAAALARLSAGVLCIDADVGLRNLDIVMGLSELGALDLADVLAGSAALDRAVLRHGSLSGLSLLPAPLALGDGLLPAFDKLAYEAKQLYDFVLIDCPAGVGSYFQMAARAADLALVVATPDAVSLRDATRMTLAWPDPRPPMRLIVNRVRPKLIHRAYAPNIDDAMDAVGLPLLGIVPEDERVIVGGNRGTLIPEDAGKRSAARAFGNIARRLLGEDVPVMRL